MVGIAWGGCTHLAARSIIATTPHDGSSFDELGLQVRACLLDEASSAWRWVYDRARTGKRLAVIRNLWIWLMLQLETFDNSLIALDDDVPSI